MHPGHDVRGGRASGTSRSSWDRRSFLSRPAVVGLASRADNRAGTDRSGGTRHAKRACRGVSGTRQTAQGRVGLSTRHFALHLGSHRLLSAMTSALKDAERPLRSRPGAGLAGTCEDGPAAPLATRGPAASVSHASDQAWGPKLVPAGDSAISLPRGLSRGKGVLAA